MDEADARWAAVDTYFTASLSPDDSPLVEARAANAVAGLPPHDVSPLQGRMLALFVQITNAHRVLEIGTLGGYSTIHMARALPSNGMIVTLESNPHHAAVARQNFVRAGVTGTIDLRLGRAQDILPNLAGPFDLIFIDADKPSNPIYMAWALKLSRPGTVIIADNVVRGGEVANPESPDAAVQGVRRLLDVIAAEPRLIATAIQTVGLKGWDGFILARVGQVAPKRPGL